MNDIDFIKGAAVELRFKFPNETEFRRIAICLDSLSGEVVTPLDPLHDVPFLPMEAVRAQEKIQARRKLAAYIGNLFAEKLVDLIQGRDPVKGYSPEENRKFNLPR